MTHYKKWDIVLVPFPFTDLSTSKRRPALVISPNNYNEGRDIIIAFITSNLNIQPRPGDYIIKEWDRAGLPKPSMIRMKYATIDKKIIVKQLGRLYSEDAKLFLEKLVNFFKE